MRTVMISNHDYTLNVQLFLNHNLHKRKYVLKSFLFENLQSLTEALYRKKLINIGYTNLVRNLKSLPSTTYLITDKVE